MPLLARFFTMPAPVASAAWKHTSKKGLFAAPISHLRQ